MKRMPVMVGLVVLAVLGWHLARPTEPAGKAGPVLDLPTTTVTDAAEVFRRAFWRHPGEADRIVHAERREWLDDDDEVEHWAWFMEVEPSPELRDYLIDRNAFGLRELEIVRVDGPSWFPREFGGYRIIGVRDGGMCLLWREGSDRIFATGKGMGFSRGAVMPPAQTPVSRPLAGRIPSSPPPDPR